MSAAPDSMITMQAAVETACQAHAGTAVNQHWLHSLEQFYAEATVAWQEHCRRTDELIGTAAGRIAR